MIRKIEIYKGNSPNIEIEVNNQVKADFNLTNYDIDMYINGADDGNSSQTIHLSTGVGGGITITNAATGLAVAKLTTDQTNAMTGCYEFYVNVSDADEEYTILTGVIEVKELG